MQYFVFPGAPHRPPEPSEFASSDYVSMELDTEIFQMLQETHGGWNFAMADVYKFLVLEKLIAV